MGVPTDRGPPAIVREFDSETEPTEQGPSRDFRITAAHRIGQGSLSEKARDNLAAIRILKQIETENRYATDSEKNTLVRYSGWGAMPNAFNRHQPREWERTANEVRALLTDDEYSAARASTPNAHFTSPLVIGAMWDSMRHLGLSPGAHILEPSMGVGHFLGLMPDDLLQGSRRTGVELDAITARIASRLYRDSTVFTKGFEDTPLPENFFDAAIGNIPFGNYPVFDPSYRDRPALTRAIHDYFFAKSLDKLRPGGVLALITSRYTMDKQDSTIRQYLAEHADLIGAIRLPNMAFKANAGTEVTTDILFLQKHGAGTPAKGETWGDLAPVETPDGAVAVNEYFARHPEMMLGQMRLEGTMYRNDEPALVGELSRSALAGAVASLPPAVFRGFQILSRGRGTPRFTTDDDRLPELFVRGAGTYAAHLNPDRPIGTVQSIEHTLRALERVAAEERESAQRLEKDLTEYQAEANRSFEHEARLKSLLARQAELNAALDLDKGDR